MHPGLTDSARCGVCDRRIERTVRSDEGTDSNDGSVETSNSNSDGAMREELIEIDETIERPAGSDPLVDRLARDFAVRIIVRLNDCRSVDIRR